MARGHDGGGSSEAFRNWGVDWVVHRFLSKYKKQKPRAHARLISAVKRHEAEARIAVIGLSSILGKVVNILPIEHIPLLGQFAESIRGQAREVGEQLQSSILIYARGEPDLPDTEAPKPDEVTGLFTEFRVWAEGAIGEMKHDLTRGFLLILPFFEVDLEGRERHIAAISSLTRERFRIWSGFVQRLSGSKRTSIMHNYGILANPDFLDRILDADNDLQRLALLDAYGLNGVTAAVRALGHGVNTVVTAICTPVNDRIAASRAARAARRDVLPRCRRP